MKLKTFAHAAHAQRSAAGAAGRQLQKKFQKNFVSRLLGCIFGVGLENEVPAIFKLSFQLKRLNLTGTHVGLFSFYETQG